MRDLTYYTVSEVNLMPPYDHKRIWRFTVENLLVKNHYRAVTSLSSFFYNTKRRNQKGNKFLYICRRQEEWDSFIEFDKRVCKTIGENYQNPKIIPLNSIWQFYKVIGYDYKKQKWLDKTGEK